MLPFVFIDFVCFLPEIFIGCSICFFLVYGSFISTIKFFYLNKTFILRKVCFWVTLQLLLLVIILLCNNPVIFGIAFYGCVISDFASFFSKIILVFLCFCSILVSFSYLKGNLFNAFEYFVLVLFSCLAMLLIISANDLVSFYLSLELQALAFYTLASFKRNSAFSTEAGLKYFIMGAFSSGIFLFGSSLVYGSTGSTNFMVFKTLFFIDFFSGSSNSLLLGLVFIFVGFLFKLGAAPWHLWMPDVYEGSPTCVSLFFAIVPKMALLCCLARVAFSSFFSLVSLWEYIFLFSSFFSIAVGSFGALGQRKIKRFLAFSSIGHIGFILLCFACGSLEGLQSAFFYVILYSFMAFSFWSFLLVFNFGKPFKYLDDLEFLIFENPVLVGILVFLLFSIAGIPPLGGFYAKFFVFFCVVESSFYFFALVTVFFSAVSAFYYLRIVKILSYQINFFNKASFLSKFSFYSEISKSHGFALSFSFFVLFFFSIIPGILLLVTHRVAINFMI